MPASKPLVLVNFEALKIMAIHQFEGSLEWSGNSGKGTSAYNQSAPQSTRKMLHRKFRNHRSVLRTDGGIGLKSLHLFHDEDNFPLCFDVYCEHVNGSVKQQ